MAVDEVRLGYKRTEVGVIPEDWETSTVGAHFDIQLGKMLDAARNLGTLKPYINNVAVRWGSFDIAEVGSVPLTTRDTYRYRLVDGDLVVCEGGEIGRSAIWRDELPDCYFQKTLHRLRAKGRGNSIFFRYLLELWSSSGFLERFATQTSIAHLTKEALSAMPLPIPRRTEEQAVIADVLDSCERLVQQARLLLAKKRDSKQSVTQELLQPQTSWITNRIGLIAPLQRGFDLPGDKIVPGPFPIVYSNGRSGNHHRAMSKGPGVVTGRSGTLGSVHFVEEAFWPHNTTLWVTDFGNNDPKFIFYLFSSLNLQHYGGGSGVPTLNRNDLHDISVSVPSTLQEQQHINVILTDMDAEISELEARLAKYRAIKQGMMEKLLTGAIRLV